MICMKHRTLGNAHFPDADQTKLEALGWVRWPRTAEQKAGAVATSGYASVIPAPPVSVPVITTYTPPVIVDRYEPATIEKRKPGRPKK